MSFLALTSGARTRCSLHKDGRRISRRVMSGVFAAMCILLLGYGSIAAPGPFGKLVAPAASHVLTTRDIREATIFEQPLQPTGDPTDQENQALFQALKQFSQRTERDDFSSLTGFLRQYPDSAWAPALEVQLGRECYRVGRYS